MLSDRPYMRDESSYEALRPLLWLLGVLVGAYVVQNILERAAPQFTALWLKLSIDNLLQGRLWTLLTYSLLHEPITGGAGSLLHLLFNALAIFFFGRPLIQSLGVRRFFTVYLLAVLAGAILWTAANLNSPFPLIGASAAAYGLLALFCLCYPNDRITILLFFVIPITIVPKYLGLITAAVSALFFVFDELFPFGGQSTQMAHSAHLGGMAAGWIFFRYLQLRERNAPHREEPQIELPKWLKRKRPPAPSTVQIRPPGTDRDRLRAEVDRILDKINTSGFASLTAEEKRTLDNARDLLNKQ